MAQQAEPGRVVGGRYLLVEPVGTGGFGRVWKARDQMLDIDVAVKELWLPPGLSEAEQAERLARAAREARNAAQLRDHPNIVAVHDVVVENDLPWIVMGLVHGKSLDEHLRNGPLPAKQVKRIATALLDALEAAHTAEIVHRDVKPANVLLATNGDTLLTDFGIAVHRSDTALTETGMLIGSIEYMAPERLNGTDGLPASDLYSLGVTLYQAVEGLSPFRRGNPTATLTAVLLDTAPAPTCGGGLATMITSLLDKDPRQRPTIPQARALLEAAKEPTKKFEPEPKPPTAKFEPPPQQSQKVTPPNSPTRQPQQKWAPLAIVAVVITLLAASADLRKNVFGFVDNMFSSGTTTTTSAPTTTQTTTTRRTSSTSSSRRTTTTTKFNPADLDSASTDDTPLTVSALLPSSFTDAKNVYYSRKSSGVRDCVTKYMSQEVRNLLTRSGCGRAVAGTYVDHSNQILVMVWVVPMSDARTAKSTYDSAGSGSWGIICPQNGPGSEICDHNKDTSRAVQSDWQRHTHRYLIKSTALYINLTQDTKAQPWVDAAAREAVRAAGPSNYSGNR